ncbi:MAG: lipopolysaccharide biosynthesis protein [Dysgonamonadaceae bacterium]|jgi:O-antigen/teichoic acid export membrane protein|nr:lipopolysaccharide biosynthesis protein [Dysgonamonadaceae bacterium]
MGGETLKQQTANGLFWGGISNGVQQLAGAVFGIFLARILDPDDYGLVGMLAIFSGIASILINSGFSVALTNKPDASHDDYNAVFWFTFFAGLLLYVLLFFSAPWIARFYGRPELTALSRVLFAGFFFGGVSTVFHTILFKNMQVKRQAGIDIVSFLVACSIGITMALNGFAYWSLAVQTLVYILLMFLLRFLLVPWKPTCRIRFSPLRPLLSFSFKLFLTQIFMQLNTHLFSVLLGRFYNAAQVGHYSQGQKWMLMGNSMINGTLVSVAQPVLVRTSDDKPRQVAVMRKLIRFGAFLSFPLMLGLAFVGKEFILVAIGEKWLPAVPFLQLFCIWGALGFLWTLFVNLINVHGKSNLYLYVNLAVGLVQLLVVAVLYPKGVFPMVAGYLSVSIAGLLVWQYFVRQLIGLRLADILKDLLPYLLTTIACFFVAGLVAQAVRNVYALLAVKILVSAILYIVVMKVSRSVIFGESVEFLFGRLRKKNGK